MEVRRKSGVLKLSSEDETALNETGTVSVSFCIFSVNTSITKLLNILELLDILSFGGL